MRILLFLLVAWLVKLYYNQKMRKEEVKGINTYWQHKLHMNVFPSDVERFFRGEEEKKPQTTTTKTKQTILQQAEVIDVDNLAGDPDYIFFDETLKEIVKNASKKPPLKGLKLAKNGKLYIEKTSAMNIVDTVAWAKKDKYTHIEGIDKKYAVALATLLPSMHPVTSFFKQRDDFQKAALSMSGERLIAEQQAACEKHAFIDQMRKRSAMGTSNLYTQSGVGGGVLQPGDIAQTGRQEQQSVLFKAGLEMPLRNYNSSDWLL